MGKSKTYELKPKKTDPSYRLKETNYPAKKYKKGSPTITRLSFEIPAGRVTRYIDIAKALSALNRKMYRQGCYYYVTSVEMYDNGVQTTNLMTVPDNWVTRSAYRRAKGLYDEMINRAHDTLPSSIVPKYHDFRVYMSDLHRTTGTLDVNLYGVNDLAQAVVPDEYQYTEFVTHDTNDGSQPADEFYAHMIGGTVETGSGATSNVHSVGLISSYGKGRATVHQASPNLQNIDVSDPLMNLFDYSAEEVQNDIIFNLDENGDLPPYDIDEYVGANVDHMEHQVRLSTAGTVGRVIHGQGFCAPLGLICVDPVPVGQGETDTAFRIVLNIASGPYNGVYAERMA